MIQRLPPVIIHKHSMCFPMDDSHVFLFSRDVKSTWSLLSTNRAYIFLKLKLSYVKMLKNKMIKGIFPKAFFHKRQFSKGIFPNVQFP